MKHPRIYSLLLLLSFYSSCKQAQPYPPADIIQSVARDSVSPYGPTRMVRNVKQARNGDILIASYSGVWRYDGKLFTNITGAIKSPSFWDVLEDRKGNLWFGTKDSGIYSYNGRSFLHYTTRQGLPSNSALHLYEDRAGNIWFAVGSGATRYDGKSFRHFTTKDGLPKDGVNTFMEDKAGRLWIGTRSDACIYDGKTFTVFKNQDGKPFYNVWAIVEDQKGNIWFGGSIVTNRKGSTLFLNGGLWRYDGSTYTMVSQKGASAIMEDKKGNIWTTGASDATGAGAWKFLRYDQRSMYDQVPMATEILSIDKMLCGILEANDGSIWFGSIKGVYRYDGKTVMDLRSSDGQLLPPYTTLSAVDVYTGKGKSGEILMPSVSRSLNPAEREKLLTNIMRSEGWFIISAFSTMDAYKERSCAALSERPKAFKEGYIGKVDENGVFSE